MNLQLQRLLGRMAWGCALCIVTVLPLLGQEKPVWQRDTMNESCAQYQARMSANNYELWRHWNCIHSTESRSCEEYKVRFGSTTIRPYFYGEAWGNRERNGWTTDAGCACIGAPFQPQIQAGRVVDCGVDPPPNPLIFADGFEDGNTSRWQ